MISHMVCAFWIMPQHLELWPDGYGMESLSGHTGHSFGLVTVLAAHQAICEFRKGPCITDARIDAHISEYRNHTTQFRHELFDFVIR
jgi:hypothetical protein